MHLKNASNLLNAQNSPGKKGCLEAVISKYVLWGFSPGSPLSGFVTIFIYAAAMPAVNSINALNIYIILMPI
ncbi:MAG: hypothetical protein LBV08_08505 [Clostridiales bacterium]|nr:hypothetical protein [Clostridiales bacterium]